MATQSPFEKWITDSELSEQTVKALEENGLTSLKSCQKLTENLIQKTFKSLSLGQILLLQDAVKELRAATKGQTLQCNEPQDQMAPSTSARVASTNVNTSQQDPEPQVAIGSEGLDMTRICELLNIDKNQTSAQPSSDGSKGNIFDPLQYSLLTSTSACTSKLKAKDVRDYIMFGKQHESDQSRSEQTITIGHTELSLSDKKLPLEKVTPLQYMEGSLKILCEMVTQDKIDTSEILEHVGYLAKIACMGQMFAWSSVTKYDAEYRKSQAAQGFQWGADSPFLMQLLLKHRDVQGASSSGMPRGYTRNHQQRRQRHDPTSGRIICEKFNGKNGCTLARCRFVHVGGSCYMSAHGEFSHHAHRITAPRESTQPAPVAAALPKNWTS